MPLTILQLEAEGFTAIECTCKGCGHVVSVAFDFIRERRPNIDMRAETIADLGRRMPCGNCGGRDCTYQEVRKGEPARFETGPCDRPPHWVAILKNGKPVRYASPAVADRYINDADWREEIRLSEIPLHLRRRR